MATASFSLTKEIESQIAGMPYQTRMHGPVGDSLFFKSSGTLGIAANELHKLIAMREVVGNRVVRPFAVLEVQRAERSARIVGDAELEIAATAQGSEAKRSSKQRIYGIVMERVDGAAASLVREAALERMLRGAPDRDQREMLLGLLDSAYRVNREVHAPVPAEPEVARRLGGIFDSHTYSEIQSRIFSGVSAIIGKLHSRGVAHGDVYGWNIILANGSDFSIVLVDPNARCGCRTSNCEHFDSLSRQEANALDGLARPFTSAAWSIL